ncbi:MAG: hypothetical protein V4446_12680 [Pseudomonadota bacterium]
MSRLPATKRTRHYGARTGIRTEPLTGVEAKTKGAHTDHDKACK